MRIERRFLKVLAVGIFPAMGWLVPASLWCQAVTLGGATLTASAEVARLEQEAQALYSTPARFGEAGVLLERAGRLLAVEDLPAVDLLIQAARLEYYAGDLGHARACMSDAGWRALGNGRVQVAANAYADAAVIAMEQGDQVAAEEFVAIVKLLARWPGVGEKARRQILDRIG